jgi:hypothetical protein
MARVCRGGPRGVSARAKPNSGFLVQSAAGTNDRASAMLDTASGIDEASDGASGWTKCPATETAAPGHGGRGPRLPRRGERDADLGQRLPRIPRFGVMLLYRVHSESLALSYGFLLGVERVAVGLCAESTTSLNVARWRANLAAAKRACLQRSTIDCWHGLRSAGTA